MENRIKEQQLGLFSDRSSCRAWRANQFRLLPSSLAYVLLEALRRLGLSGTQLARAQVGTIRLRLLKIVAVITRNTRHIRLWLSSRFPLQQLFCSLLGSLLRVSFRVVLTPAPEKQWWL
jgi:Transposase DDE domain group 1